VGAVPLDGGGKLALLEDDGVEGVLLAPAAGVVTSEDDTNVGDGVAGGLVPPPQPDIAATNAIKIGESYELILFMYVPRIFERAKCRNRRDECDTSSDELRRHLIKTNSYMQ
jgi:hypothetical protein